MALSPRSSLPFRPVRSISAVAAAIAIAVAVVCPARAGTAAGAGHVAVMASAVDAAGRPVGDLTASDLNAQFESGGATVTSVAHVGAPTQIIVLLDTSATNARGPQKMLWNTQCVVSLAEHLAGNTNFMVLGFSDKVSELYNGTADPKAIGKSLENVSRGGQAALFEVIKFMGETVAQQQVGDHTVLVVVSDGIDTVSKASTSDVVRALGLAGIPLYTCIVMDPSWNESNLSKLNAKTKLQDMSKSTGGMAQVMTPGETKDAAGKIASLLAGRYRIEIEAGGNVKPKGETKLTLGARRDGVSVYYADHVYN